MATVFKIKKNDTRPPLAVTLQSSNGTAIDLTGGSVMFNLGNITYGSVVSGLATITGSTTGQCEYRWTGSPDTQTIGTYFGEFEFIKAGSKQTFPPEHDLKIIISEDYN